MNARLAWAMARWHAKRVAELKTEQGKRRQACRCIEAIKRAMKMGKPVA